MERTLEELEQITKNMKTAYFKHPECLMCYDVFYKDNVVIAPIGSGWYVVHDSCWGEYMCQLREKK